MLTLVFFYTQRNTHKRKRKKTSIYIIIIRTKSQLVRYQSDLRGTKIKFNLEMSKE